MEDREEGITFSEILQAIKRQIWIVLAITLAGTLIVSLVFGLFLNPRSAEYEMSFNLLYPSGENARYPDGSPFYDFDIVSSDFLEEAKGTDESFSNIDVARMIRYNDIRLAKQQMETGSDIYTITVKGTYFSNREAAEKFIRAVAQVPVSRITANAQNVDYALNPAIFGGASFEEKLELLSQWKGTLLGALDEWVELYGATYPVNGNTLGNCRSAIYVVYGDSTKSILKSEFETNGYDGLDIGSYDTPDEEAAAIERAIKVRTDVLNAEKTLNQEIIDALIDATKNENQNTGASTYARVADTRNDGDTAAVIVDKNGYMDAAEMIAYYTKRNAQIEYQLNTSLKAENVKSFMDRLDGQFEELKSAAETVSLVASSVYAQNTAVSFHTQRAQRIGGTNLVLVIVCALLISFIISVIVAYFVNNKKKRKTEGDTAAKQSDKESDQE